MPRGRVVNFDDPKGYGFISREGGPDIFVYYEAIQCEGHKTLEKGQIVDYEIETGPKGKPQAANVRVVEVEVA